VCFLCKFSCWPWASSWVIVMEALFSSLSLGQKTATATVTMFVLLWHVLGSPTQVFLFLLGCLASFAAGAIAYLLARVHFSPPFSSSTTLPPKSALRSQEANLAIIEARARRETDSPTAPHITRSIDQALNEIVDLISKDYVFYWVDGLMASQTEAKARFKKDCWTALDNFSARVAKVDMVKVLATNLVKKIADHLEKIRLIQEELHANSPNGAAPTFVISPHLTSAEREIEYLAKLSEALVILLCEDDYGDCTPVRHLLREVLSRHVLFPLVAMITDPVFINAKILAHLKKRKEAEEREKRPFADSLDELAAAVAAGDDPEELLRLRRVVVAEIARASTAARAVREGERAGAAGRYLAQLRHAQRLCESRLAVLGRGGDFGPSSAGKISFRRVLASASTRRHFASFLDEEGQGDLLAFWSSVEELKEADRKLWHQLATDVFYSFINKSERSDSLMADRQTLKRVEAFLMGDGGPEVFFEMQGRVAAALRENYFPHFLVSPHAVAMAEEAANAGLLVRDDSRDGARRSVDEEAEEAEEVVQDKGELVFSGHSGMAKNLLEQLKEKFTNKSQALAVRSFLKWLCLQVFFKALKSSLKPDSKILLTLQQEIEGLKEEKRSVKDHIDRTESWANNLGEWQCEVNK